MTQNKAHYDELRRRLLVATVPLDQFTYRDVFDARLRVSPDLQWLSYSFCTNAMQDWINDGLIVRVPHPEGKKRPHVFRWVE